MPINLMTNQIDKILERQKYCTGLNSVLQKSTSIQSLRMWPCWEVGSSESPEGAGSALPCIEQLLVARLSLWSAVPWLIYFISIMSSRFINVTNSRMFLVKGWTIVPCVNVPHFLYPVIHRWILLLFHCLGYYKEYCIDPECRYLFEIPISIPLATHLRWDCWIIWSFCFMFWGAPTVLHMAVLIYIPSNSVPFLHTLNTCHSWCFWQWPS